MHALSIFLITYQVLILVYFLLLNGSYTAITAFAFVFIRRSARATPDQTHLEDLVTLSNLRPVSVLVPAYNEQINIAATVRNLSRLRYQEYEVVVINDGSTDDTLEVLRKEFDLLPVERPPKRLLETAPVRQVLRSSRLPHLWVVDKDNGGKADALNAGLAYSSYPLFCAVDADSLLEDDALLRMGQQFLLDRSLVAAGGAVRAINGCRVEDSRITEVRAPRSILANIQVAEYLRGFMAGRTAFAALDSLLIISGAFGIFRKDLVLAIGGFRKTVGEDMDLVLRLHRHCVDEGIPYRVRYVPEPVCWTQVPEDLGSLLGQRNRWQRGLVDCMWHNRVMLFNPRYGKAGMIGMPYFFVFEMLGPLVEFLGYFSFVLFLVFGMVDPLYAELFFLVSIAWGMWLNASAVALDNFTKHRYGRIRDAYRIALLGTLEYIGYRQIVTVERLLSTFQVWRSHWGSPKRQQFHDAEQTPDTKETA